MSTEDDRDYTDVPAESLQVTCRSCDGDGWRYVARAAVAGDRMLSVAKPEPCTECAAGEDRVPTGKVNLGTGPGAKLKPWQRKPVPGVDDWGPRRS